MAGLTGVPVAEVRPPAAPCGSAMGGVVDLPGPDADDPAAAEAAVRAARWADARRVLAVRLDNLGDVLMTTPALRALRQAAADVRLILLAGGAGAALAPHLPELDDVIVAACPWMPGSDAGVDSMQALVGRLRAERFDAAVIFTVYSQSALPAAMLCWMAGIPLRLAYCRENPYHLLTDWVPDPEPHEILRHEVRRQLDLVAFVGARTPDERLSFRVDAVDRISAIARLREAGVDPLRPYAVVHPGATALSRRYPPELFAAALRQFAALAGDSTPQLVLTGDAGDVELVEHVRSASGPAVSLAGKLSLGELAAVLERAAILIANNTGPVHLAAALGVPVVDLYALTNPQHAPWKTPCRVLYEDVPCRYCYRSVCPQGHHACLRLLDPERVAIAARELLDHGAEAAVPPFRIVKA